jgi:hypothetical protein
MLRKLACTALLLFKKPKKQPKHKTETKKQPPSSLSHPGNVLLQPNKTARNASGIPKNQIDAVETANALRIDSSAASF